MLQQEEKNPDCPYSTDGTREVCNESQCRRIKSGWKYSCLFFHEDRVNMECALHYSKTTCASVTWHKAAGLQVLWQVVTGRLLFLLYF